MEKRIIKAIIAERQQEISKIQLVERPIYFEEQANYVLVGIRRAGKSYQMYQDIQNLVRLGKVTFEDCLYINFEDERISSIEASELGLLLECYAEMYDNRKPLIYLDETPDFSDNLLVGWLILNIGFSLPEVMRECLVGILPLLWVDDISYGKYFPFHLQSISLFIRFT